MLAVFDGVRAPATRLRLHQQCLLAGVRVGQGERGRADRDEGARGETLGERRRQRVPDQVGCHLGGLEVGGDGRGPPRIEDRSSGQMIFNGRNQPSVAGSAGSVMALNTVRTPETKPLQVQLIGPGTCGWLPVKSQTTRVSEICTRTWTGNGPLPRPSSSVKSEAVKVPCGMLVSASRASCSLRSKITPIAWTTVSAPYLAHISCSRRSATSRQAACAARSPRVISGSRQLAARIARTSGTPVPSR